MSSSLVLLPATMNLTSDEERLWKLFHPKAAEQIDGALKKHVRFVHCIRLVKRGRSTRGISDLSLAKGVGDRYPSRGLVRPDRRRRPRRFVCIRPTTEQTTS